MQKIEILNILLTEIAHRAMLAKGLPPVFSPGGFNATRGYSIPYGL